MRLFYLIAFVIVFAGCASRSLRGSEDGFAKRNGTFSVKSSEMGGSGSIVYRETASRDQLFFYSPFGSKLAQLDRKGDSITLFQGNELWAVRGVNSPVIIPGILEIEEMTIGDLFILMSGKATAEVSSIVNGEVGSGTNSSRDSVSVDMKRGEIKEVFVQYTQYSLRLKSYKIDHFREIRLDLGRRNYFLVEYE